jgi:hypothetical protein
MGANNADFRGEPSHMTANEIVAKYPPADLEDWDANHDWEEEKPSEKDFWEGKYYEAAHDGMVKDLVDNGVKEPVTLSKTYGITDGHHRIAVMLKHAPNQLIPVRHDD